MQNIAAKTHASAETGADRSAPAAQPIRLLLLPDAADAEGGPLPALLLPTASAGMSKLRAFPTIAAALAAKRSMETAQ